MSQVLVTGAFGNVGQNAVRELAARGHRVRCFDLQTGNTVRLARQLPPGVEVMFGDVRRAEDAARAVGGQEVVVHLAAIIPPRSDAAPELARQVNVDGTRNVLEGMRAAGSAGRLVFTSSVGVFAREQPRPPPRTADDPVAPTDVYSQHKIECEALVRASGLRYSILRLAAVVPPALPRFDMREQFRIAFEIPLHQRIETVDSRDVGLALANAAGSEEVWGKTLLIGGGPRCQILWREYLRRTLEAMGFQMFPDEAFGSSPFHTEWMDTGESERLLRYQRHTVEDYIAVLSQRYGWSRPLVAIFRPLLQRIFLGLSRPWRERAGRRATS